MSHAAPYSLGRWLALVSVVLIVPHALADNAGGDLADARLRLIPYTAERVYRLTGYVGYQIDLQFEAGEHFVGLGAGDLASLAFAAEENHLFLKPRAAQVETNLTVLTTRRSYQFDYSATARRPDPALGDVIYALRFTYPAPPATQAAADGLERRLAQAAAERTHNLAYGYRGSGELKPESAWDDGVQTHVRFAARRELPAMFVRNDDGSESLVNFSIDADEVIVHRVARQFVVRRGGLRGCIVNEHFSGSGERLRSGTITPAVERAIRAVPP